MALSVGGGESVRRAGDGETTTTIYLHYIGPHHLDHFQHCREGLVVNHSTVGVFALLQKGWGGAQSKLGTKRVSLSKHFVTTPGVAGDQASLVQK